MKPFKFVSEMFIYIVLVAICGPYAVMLYKMGYYGLSYVNAGATLLVVVIATDSTISFIKNLINNPKRKGRRFK